MNVTVTDYWMEDGDLRMFARSWQPDVVTCQAPVLLFHDSLGCVDLWRSFPLRLAEATGRRVLAYDRVGFGRSDPYPGVLDIGFIADEPRRSIPILSEGLSFDRFVACGHSVGGGMAVETAALFPERCEAVVTMGVQAFAESRTLDGIRIARESFLPEDSLVKLKRYHGEKARWVVDAWTEIWLDPRFRSWSLDRTLASVRAPVLAIHGDHDEYGSPAHPRRIAGDHGQIVIIPGAGHVLHREVESNLVEIIARFLLRSLHA